MSTNGRSFVLPGLVDQYLATLNRLYERKDERLLRQVVVNGTVAIHEEWDYDNWNGGTYGHAVTLTVPEDLYLEIVDLKDDFQTRIATDLNSLDNLQNEHISAVFIEMMPEDNDHWRENSGILRQRAAASSVPADALQRIWGAEHVRLFLSHKSSVKEQTSALKQSFARCGIAAFVAHEDIEPTEEWQREIERALFSMDALIALLTGDYHDSNWTDQEVGVAIGRGVPLIAVRLGRDPYGLMGKSQGVGGCTFENPLGIAIKVLQLLHKRLPDKSRLFESALAAYSASTTWADSGWKVKNLLSHFDDLTESQVSRVIQAYRANRENSRSFEGMNGLQPLLEKWTGKQWVVRNNELFLAESRTDFAESPEVPF